MKPKKEALAWVCLLFSTAVFAVDIDYEIEAAKENANKIKNTDVFITDIESSLKNLIYQQHLTEKIRIIRFWKTLSKFNLDKLIRILFKLFEKNILKNLYSENPCLSLLQFYKLGYFIQTKNSINSTKNYHIE